MKSNLLFIPRHETSWSKMQIIINLIHKNFNCKVLVCSKKLDQLIDNDYEKIRVTNYKNRNFFQIILNRVDDYLDKYEKLSNFIFFSLIRICLTTVIYRCETIFFKKILEKLSLDLIFLPGDRELSPVLPISKASNILNIPSIVSVTSIPDPTCLHYGRSFSKLFYTSLTKGGSITNKLASIFLPDQVFSHSGKKLLFSPGWRTFGLYFGGCISSNPWVQGGGNANYVFETDKIYKKKAESFGRCKNKTLVIGDPLGKITKKEIKIEKNIILFCVPNEAEHNLISWGNHLNRIRLIAETINNLKKNMRVVFNLHPKSKISNYSFLKNEFGFTHGKKKFYAYLSEAKLVVCGASSIIPVIVALETPVLNIDDLNYWNENMVDINFGVKTLKSLDNLKISMKNYIHELPKNSFKKKLSKSAKIMKNRLLLEKDFKKNLVKIIKYVLQEN